VLLILNTFASRAITRTNFYDPPREEPIMNHGGPVMNHGGPVRPWPATLNSHLTMQVRIIKLEKVVTLLQS